MTDSSAEIVVFLEDCYAETKAIALAASGGTVIGEPGNWKPAPGGDEWATSESADGDQEVLVALRTGLPRPPDVMGGLWGQVIAAPERYDEDDWSAMPRFRHMARHDPARALAGAKAGQRLLALADRMDAAAADSEYWPLRVFALEIRKNLAAEYVGQPGYKPEWVAE